MLPGHHGTFGLRISRVEMRMKPNETTSPARTRKTHWRSLATSWSFQKSEMKLAASNPDQASATSSGTVTKL